MRIMIMCCSGMSSSLLTVNILEAAKQMGIKDIYVEAINSKKAPSTKLYYDCIFLAPQVRYQKDTIKKIVGDSIPIEVLDMKTYGNLDGKKVLEKALELLK